MCIITRFAQIATILKCWFKIICICTMCYLSGIRRAIFFAINVVTVQVLIRHTAPVPEGISPFNDSLERIMIKKKLHSWITPESWLKVIRRGNHFPS